MRISNIIIADDHPVVLAGVRMLINNMALGRVLAEATTVDSLMEQLQHYSCDILITDFSMPDSCQPDGLEMLNQVRKSYPNVKIIVLTQIQNIGTLQALQLLSDAIVLKQSLLTDLKQATTAVCNNRPYLSAKVKQLLSEKGLTQNLSKTKLSPRESEVVRLFCSGSSVSQIATKLDRSIKTVSTQKQNAMKKLGVTTDSELFAYSRYSGLS